MSTDGILIVNKPRGWTSFDVVGFVRGRSRVRRVGHAGTLDPAAEGVLPVCLGQATRLVEYLMDARKEYVADVRLGVVTDTYDADGTVTSSVPADHVGRSDVESALEAFRGEIEQRPPPFSALKREGVPLYKLARRGEAVEAPARRVSVFRLELISFEAPVLTLRVECSKGTYIRSLAHDLGAALGVGGSLQALTRTRVGRFRIGDAVDIETLRSEMETDAWQRRLYAPDEVLLDWPAAVLGDDNERLIRHGRGPAFDLRPGIDPSSLERCRAYGLEGDFLAVLRRDDVGGWRPEKVFAGT